MTIACAPGRLRHEHAKRATELSGTWRRLWTLLGAISTALPEAFHAFRHYEQLRSIGVPHDMAIRDALAAEPERACSDGHSSGTRIAPRLE